MDFRFNARFYAWGIPNYATAIVTTTEIVDSISSLQTLGISAPTWATFGFNCPAGKEGWCERGS